MGRMGYSEDTTRSAFSLTAATVWSTLVKFSVFIRVIRKSLNRLERVSKERKERSLLCGHEIFHALIKCLDYKGCPRHNVAWTCEWPEPHSELSDSSTPMSRLI